MQKSSRLALIAFPLLALLSLPFPAVAEQPESASPATDVTADVSTTDGVTTTDALTTTDAVTTDVATTDPTINNAEIAVQAEPIIGAAAAVPAAASAESADESAEKSAEVAAEPVAPTESAERAVESSTPVTEASTPEVKNSASEGEVVTPAAVEVAEPEKAAKDAPASVPAAAPDAASIDVVVPDEAPAPIIEAAPPHRAENVDLREVVPAPAAPVTSATPEEVAAVETVEPAPPEGTPLVLLGSEVPPSTAARLAWSPSESFAGIAAPTPVLVINGAQPGPVLCLTAAIHGDELVGIEVVRRVLYTIDAKQLSGALIGVPIVNLQGFRRGSRYLPDRRDLNRYFPGNTYGSSAARIAYSFFNEIVSKCDVLVDLHTGSFHRTNLPQVRADLNNADVASLSKGFGATAVLQSRGSRGSLRRAAVEAGIPAVTLEAGEPMRLNEEPVAQGVRSVESLLDSLGMLKTRSIWSRREQPVFYKSTWVRANEGGVLMSKVRLGQRVKIGDLLGTVSDPITNAQHDIISPYAGRIIGMALNQVMMPGFAAYHIGIQATVKEAAQPDPSLDTAIDELDDEDAEPIPEAPTQPGSAPASVPGAGFVEDDGPGEDSE